MQARLAGLDHRMGRHDARIEFRSGKRDHRPSGRMPVAASHHFLVHGGEPVRSIVQRCPENRLWSEIIERQYAEHGVEHGNHAVSVKPDQPSPMLEARVIAIHQRDFIAMSHGPQAGQQVRAQERV